MNETPPSSTKPPRMAMLRAEIHQGPLPPVEEFRRYNEISPGAAERILNYMDTEQRHRHVMEKRAIPNAAVEIYIGQLLAFAVMLCLIGAALFCAIYGYTALGITFMGMTALGIVGKFIDGRAQGNKKSGSTPH